jgi:hypothetical protein
MSLIRNLLLVQGGQRRLLDSVLTAGQRGEALQGKRLLESFRRVQLGAIIADLAYGSDATEASLRDL